MTGVTMWVIEVIEVCLLSPPDPPSRVGNGQLNGKTKRGFRV